MRRAKNRLVLMLLVMLIPVALLLLIALQNWQAYTENAVISQAFRSQVFQVNSIILDHSLVDNVLFSVHLNEILSKDGVQRVLIVDKSGNVLQSAPQVWYRQSIHKAVAEWGEKVNHFDAIPAENPLMIRDGRRVHIFQRLYVPIEKWPDDVVLYVEIDSVLLMGNVKPLWQHFFWWSLGGL